MRLFIDYWLGNGNYSIEQNEYEDFMKIIEEEQDGEIEENTKAYFTVDDIYYDLENSTMEFENFTGWWNQTNLITMLANENYTSNQTIPLAPTHTIKVNVTYENYEEYAIVHIDLPNGYGMTSYDATNVTITGITSLTIVPGGDPNPDDDITWEWVEIATVMTGNHPPDKPTNVQPPDEASGVSLSPTLKVHVVDLDGHMMNVTFYDASNDSIIGTVTNVANDSDAQVTWSGLSYSTTYEWYVIANDSILENRSETWSFTTRYPPNQPPNTPLTPSGSSSGYTRTSYSYSTSATDPDGDKVQYRFDWGDGTYSSWTSLVNSGSSASASHSWSSAGTYYVRAKARDKYDAESSWSSTKTVSITVYVPPKEKPSAPRNLTATPGDIDGEYWIKLTWDVPESDGSAAITNYSIYRGTVAGGEKNLIDTIGNILTYNDTGLTNNVTYYYQVSARNSVGEGPKSNEANATTEDTAEPVIADIIVSPTKVKAGEKVNISANVTDSSGIDRVFVIIKKDGKEVERINLTKGIENKWSVLWKPTKEGTYNLVIKAMDTWGNPVSIDIGMVKVEKKPLSVSVIAAIIIAIIVAIAGIVGYYYKKRK
jgi:YD repeat-containing protein